MDTALHEDVRLRDSSQWRLLMMSVVVSVVGDILASVAVGAYLAKHGGPGWVATLFVIALSARTLVARSFGRLVDRHHPATALVTADIFRLVVMVIIAILVVRHADAAAIVAAYALASLGGALGRPAFAALVPRLVPADLLVRANAVESSCHQLGWIAGAVGGSIITAVWSVDAAVLVNAGTFCVSALIAASVGRRTPPAETDERHLIDSAAEIADPQGPSAVEDSGMGCADSRSGNGVEHFAERALGDLAADAAETRECEGELDGRHVRLLIVGASLIAATFGAEMLLDFSLAERLGWGDAGAGYLIAANGLGGLLGALLIKRLDRVSPVRTMVGCSLAIAGSLLCLAITIVPTVAVATRAVEGAAGLIGDVVLVAMLQRRIGGDRIGSVFGRLDQSCAGGQLAALACSGAFARVISLPLMTAVTAGLALGSGVVLTSLLKRGAGLVLVNG